MTLHKLPIRPTSSDKAPQGKPRAHCAGRPRRRGILIVWVVLLFLVLLGFMGLALDTAYIVLVRQQLQNAADASALAGAAHVVGSDGDEAREALIRQSAQDTAASNYAAGKSVAVADGDVVVGHYYRPGNSKGLLGFYPASDPLGYGSPYNAVQVITQRTTAENGEVPLIFGPFFGVNAGSLTASAIAKANIVQAGIIVLDPSGPSALWIHGNPIMSLTQDGAIQVNSDNSQAVVVQGNSTVQTPAINVEGGYVEKGGPTVTGQVNTGVGAVADPLAGLPAPADGPDQVQGTSPLQPGHYANGINITNGTWVFSPGIYVVDNGLKITGGTIVAQGVMFYVKSGPLDMSGNALLDISPPTSGTYEGVSIFQARDNTTAGKINGTSGSTITGTIYVPSALLTLTGTTGTNPFGNQIISYDLEVAGNGTFNIDYDGRNPASGRPYLVK